MTDIHRVALTSSRDRAAKTLEACASFSDQPLLPSGILPVMFLTHSQAADRLLLDHATLHNGLQTLASILPGCSQRSCQRTCTPSAAKISASAFHVLGAPLAAPPNLRYVMQQRLQRDSVYRWMNTELIRISEIVPSSIDGCRRVSLQQVRTSTLAPGQHTFRAHRAREYARTKPCRHSIQACLISERIAIWQTCGFSPSSA